MVNKRILAATAVHIALLFTCAMPITTFAATSTTTLTVSATISGVCVVGLLPTLSFGTYNPTLGAVLNAQGNITVTCTSGTPFNVGLDAGSGTGATVANRLMTRTSGGTQTIAYTIYTTSGMTTPWGTTIGTNTVASTGTGAAQTLTMYGQIFSTNSTSLPPASYQDTVNVTVTY